MATGNRYFLNFIAETDTYELRLLSKQLCRLHKKYSTMRGNVPQMCFLPNVRPTGGSTPLIFARSELDVSES